MKLAIFDLGGTTIRDRGEVPAAFAGALQRAGIPFQRAEIDQWRGASKRAVIATLVRRSRPAGREDTALADRAYDAFRSALKEQLSGRAHLAFAESLPCFERLAAGGWKVGINSGFDRDIVDMILDAVPWPRRLFAAIVCAADVAAGRPAPDMIEKTMALAGVKNPAGVAVIGDTRLDMEAGRNAGVAFRIGVLSGAHDRAALENARATHVVADVSQVPPLVLSVPSLHPPVPVPTPATRTVA